jgi:superfamily II DNA/RNA helicase
MSADITINPSDALDELDGEILAELDLDADSIDIDDIDSELENLTDSGDDAEFDDTDDDTDRGIAFTDLGLPEALTALLAKGGVTHPFPIQAVTIPDALAGRHVLGKARTGSGKTLAFGLPMLANLEGRRARKGKPLALVLVPTRELAMQVSEALRPFGFAIGLDITAVYGGAPMYKQVWSLRRGVEVLVATPGRLTDLIEQEECDLSDVAIAVLDEADQMADMGFMPVVSELLSQTDPAGQRLLFSATLDGAVDVLVKKYLTDPVTHSVTSEDETPTRMDHHLLVVEPNDKSMITAEIAARHTPGDDDKKRTILFARTKLGADRIAEKIREAGVAAVALHGGMTQRARSKTLEDFKLGRVPVLVATDVAARGIHVDGVDLVLHVDPANDPKDYMHRAGRTARAGEAGTVVTLVLPKQRKATLRLLEQAGVEAELTKVAPSSEVLRELTGGRPVGEYVAERDAFYEKRRAEREARGGSQRDDRERGGDRGSYRSDRDSRGGGDRGGYRGGNDSRGGYGDRAPRSFGDRDSRGRGGGGGYRGDRPASGGGFGGDRDRRSFGGSDSRGDRPAFNRTERPAFRDSDSRPATGGFDRSERPAFNRDRDARPSFNRDDRGGRPAGDRPAFNRDDRGGRPSFNRDDRGGRPAGDRPAFNRDRDARPSFNRDDRGGRPAGDRPAFNRDDRGGRPASGGFGGDRDRRSFGSSDSRGDRPAFNRGGADRPTGGGFRDRDSRPSYGNRDDRGGRPAFNRDDRAGRPAGDRDSRPSYGDRDRNAGSGSGSSFGRNGGERRGFGSAERGSSGGAPRGNDRPSFGDRDNNRPPRDRRW